MYLKAAAEFSVHFLVVEGVIHRRKKRHNASRGGPDMYHIIMIPVDLEHAGQLDKALATSVDLARLYNAELFMVGVTSSAPGAVAHNPAEYAQKLEAFAAEQTKRHGIQFSARAVTSPDPAIDLDDALKATATEIGADLVVMASHVPGFIEHIFASRAGYLASHTGISVFVVR
jgi:nucleotide-binding universal stress UspA family protein